MSRAADELDLSESTVTARVHALENELGQIFFIRTALVVRTTDAGRLFQPFAQRSVQSVDEGRRALVSSRENGLLTQCASCAEEFQLTMAVGDPDAGIEPTHLHIPPVLVAMDDGYGNAFNASGRPSCLPKRCGHIAAKALISADETVGKLRAIRNTADDLDNRDFVTIARTDAVSAVAAPDTRRGLELAIERGLRYLDSGIPDLVWCEVPTAAREPTETFAYEIRRRFPDARPGPQLLVLIPLGS